MTNEIIVRRLSLIKYLYKLGVDQSSLPETISYTAILTFHDSIDMFMNLVAESKGITKGQYLIQYFDAVPELTLKASVNKINKRRNGLKHDGIIPGTIEIVDTCSVAKLFFEENVKIVFGKEFNEISLFDLIVYDKVRDLLKIADELLQGEKFEEAAREIGKAYFHLLLIEDSFNKSKKKNPWYETNPVPLLKQNKFYIEGVEPVFEGQVHVTNEPRAENGYVEISEGVASLALGYNKALIHVFEYLAIFSLGLDPKKYNYYVSFMPRVFELDTNTDKYTIGYPPKSRKNLNEFSIESISFAKEFVFEFALKLQEFKY